MTDLWLDVKQALRLGRRSPLTAAVIIGSLALGIAANTAVFSFVNAVQFKALPVVDEATLVDVSEWSATELCAGCGVGTSYPGFLDWRKQARSFSTMGAYKEMAVTISGEGEPARTRAALVSPELFPMLGVGPVRGRGIKAADETPGARRADQRHAVAEPFHWPGRRRWPDAEGRRESGDDRRRDAGRFPLA